MHSSELAVIGSMINRSLSLPPSSFSKQWATPCTPPRGPRRRRASHAGPMQCRACRVCSAHQRHIRVGWGGPLGPVHRLRIGLRLRSHCTANGWPPDGGATPKLHSTLAAACAACMHRADMSARVGSRIQRLGCWQGRVRVTRQSASNRDERETIAGYDGAVCPLPGPRVAQYLPKATPFIQQTQRTSPRAQRDPTHTCT